MRTLFRHGVLVLGTVALLGSSAAALQLARDSWYPAASTFEPTLYLTSSTALRRLSVGYSALAADLYWIRTIQYYGDMKRRIAERVASGGPAVPQPDDYAQLAPLLELTTGLDPHFNLAYRFGAIFLAEAYPGGAGRPDLAVALLEKGLRDRPDKWEYMQDIGFVHYWWRHDYPAAAQWFERASQVPGAPWFLRSLAATTLAEGGDRRSSRLMWQSIHQSAEIDWLKKDSARRLTQLDAMDFTERLQTRVDAFAAASGRAPSNWETLIRANAIPGVPMDPTGTPYELDASGRVSVSRQSTLYPLPVEPQRIQPPPP